MQLHNCRYSNFLPQCYATSRVLVLLCSVPYGFLARMDGMDVGIAWTSVSVSVAVSGSASVAVAAAIAFAACHAIMKFQVQVESNCACPPYLLYTTYMLMHTYIHMHHIQGIYECCYCYFSICLQIVLQLTNNHPADTYFAFTFKSTVTGECNGYVFVATERK